MAIVKDPQDIAPLFIVGSPRSGTTVVMRAIESLDGFYAPHVEGHLMSWLLERVNKVIGDPARYKQFFLPTSICHGDNLEKLLAWLARAIDGFEREVAGDRAQGRWIDKTPDIGQVRVLPVLQRIFPRSQVIFTYRHPRDVVLSTRNVWHPDASDKELLQRWASLHQEYRGKIRPKLDMRRVLEIRQEDIVSDPEGTGKQVGAFLGLDKNDQATLGAFFKDRRVNRLPTRKQEGFTYQATPKFLRLVKKVCGDEMRYWGYGVDEK